LVVAPYNPAWYVYNMAGVVMESLSCAVPVVAPRGSSSGNLVESFGAGATFDEFSSPSVIKAIAECAKTYPHKKQNAIAAREVFKNQHGLANFAEALLKA
jgi:glycosyltransferase involved in cell wall biosynthesis